MSQRKPWCCSTRPKKVKELLGWVPNVYKRSVVGDKVIPLVVGADIEQVHWCPPQDEMPAVKAILGLQYITPTFIMHIKELDGKPTLVPQGVAFYFGGTRADDTKKDLFELAQQGL